MPKERAPISTRLRNKDKNIGTIALAKEAPLENSRKENLELVTNNSLENNTVFSPRVDTDIYLDELQSPLSFVRGLEEEKAQFLKDEDELMSQSFGSDYKSTLNTSTFYHARISAPVPSKRTKNRKASSSANNRSLSIRESMRRIKLPFPMVNSKIKARSISPSTRSSTPTPSPTPTPTPTTPASALEASKTTSTLKAKKLVSSTMQPSKTNTHREVIAKKEAGPTNIQLVNTLLVPLPQCKKLPVYIKMDAKDKEREYWRRQRRLFVHSRFLTNEEGVAVAKSVYSNLSINPSNRMVISMQGNIANFRTKLRRVFISQADRFNISLEYISNTKDEQLIHDLTSKMNDGILKLIWEHWIADPFVDVENFYSDKKSVNLLRGVTVKLMIIHYKEQFNLYSPKQARTEMRKLDLISRTLKLPQSSEFE